MPGHPLSPLFKLDPEMQAHLNSTSSFVYADGALAKKYKYIIAMAFDAAHGAEGGVRWLANEAIKAGATTQEITEALRVAYFLAGIPALYTAARGLEEIAGE